jgi:hypothetical protein
MPLQTRAAVPMLDLPRQPRLRGFEEPGENSRGRSAELPAALPSGICGACQLDFLEFFSRNSLRWKYGSRPISDPIGAASLSSRPGWMRRRRPQHGSPERTRRARLDSEQAVTYEVAPKGTSLKQIFAHPPQASTEPETPATPHVRSGSGRLRSLESCHTFNPGRGHNLPTRLGQAFASWTVAQWNTVHAGCPVVIVLGRFDCVW